MNMALDDNMKNIYVNNDMKNIDYYIKDKADDYSTNIWEYDIRDQQKPICLIIQFNGYEGKKSIVHCVISYFNLLYVNSMIYILLPKNKGGKTLKKLFEESYKLSTDYCSNKKTDVIKILKTSKNHVKVSGEYCNKTILSKNIDGNLMEFETVPGIFSAEKVDLGTNFIIQIMKNYIKDNNGTLLDLGCGYGPIGLAIAKNYPKLSCTLLDIDKRCIECAKRNGSRNHISNINYICSNGFMQINDKFDYIVSHFPMHISSKNKSALITGMENHLTDDGLIAMVMLKKYNLEKYFSENIKLENKYYNNDRLEYCVYIYKKRK